MANLDNLSPSGFQTNAEDSHQATFALAIREFAAGHLDQAAGRCQQIVRDAPGHAQALHMLSVIHAEQGRIAEGLTCIGRALRLLPREPALYVTHGRLLLLASRYEAARSAFEQALGFIPDEPEALHGLALSLQRLGQLAAAEAAARKALILRPLAPDLLDNLGVILLQGGEVAAARDCFERALAQTGTHPGALANLALLYEQDNRLEEAEGLARKGLAVRPAALTLRLVLGRCQRRRLDYAAAQSTLSGLRETGTPVLRKDVEYELALCVDAMGDTEGAFGHMQNANALARSLYPQAESEGQAFVGLLRQLRRQFTPDWVATWRTLSAPLAVPPPVFLVGFPRSGTTLLDTMLGAHPQLTVLEERPTLQKVLDHLSRHTGEYPGSLAALDTADRVALERVYRDATLPAAGAAGYLLDKSPFHVVHLGLVERIFPGAPILFAVRHPCDVVLSCYMTNFALNSGTIHFTDLHSSVQLYHEIMALWTTYTHSLSLNYRVVRYEDLIDHPEQQLRSLTDFIGLPWSSRVLDNVAQATSRDDVRSASYAQIGRVLYGDARDRWRRYRRHLEPYLELLQPYCEMFGYDL